MINKVPKVSVLMPAYNAEKYIADSIESILTQSFKEIELIIIDDTSNDSTWDIIKKYASQDHRIKIFRNEKNLGVSKTRNKLLAKAEGKYIAWQDADDISLSFRIEEQYVYLETYQDVMIVGGFIQFIDENGEKTIIRKYAQEDYFLRKNLFKYSPVSQPVAMVRSSVFKEIGLFDEKLKQAEDLDLSFRIGKYGKFSNIQKVLLYYRFYPTSLSAQNLKENIQFTLKVRRKASVHYGYRMSLIDYVAFVATWFVQFIPSAVTQKVFPFFRSFFTKT